MPAGNIADLSMAVQAAKGTAATPAVATMARVYLAGGGLGVPKDTADLEETAGGRLRSGNYVSQVRVEGSPEFFVRPDMIGWLLWGAMGSVVDSGSVDPWTHTFSLAATQPYMTFWRMMGALLFEQFIDCKVQQLAFHSEAGQPLRVTAQIVGLTTKWRDTAESTKTVEIVAPFMHADAKSLLSFEGSPVTAIDTVDLTIATGVALAQGDDVKPNSADEGMLDITLAVQETITDFSAYQRMIYGATTPTDGDEPSPNVIELTGASIIDIGYAKRDSAGAVATPERSLHFTADRLAIASITGLETNTDGTPLKQTTTYKVYEPAGGGGLTAVLKNSQAAYAAS